MTTDEKGNECVICGTQIEAGQPRIAWFTKDGAAFSTERGAIHLAHLMQERR